MFRNYYWIFMSDANNESSWKDHRVFSDGLLWNNACLRVKRGNFSASKHAATNGGLNKGLIKELVQGFF
jgi:hypothetical protein